MSRASAQTTPQASARRWTFYADSATRPAHGEPVRSRFGGGSAGSGTLRISEGRGTTRAGSRPRQQCRPGPQGAEEEDAARGHFPRDEAPRPLRKTLREEGAREGGSHPPGAQAGAQARATRGPAAQQAQAPRPDRRSALAFVRGPVAPPRDSTGRQYGRTYRTFRAGSDTVLASPIVLARNSRTVCTAPYWSRSLWPASAKRTNCLRPGISAKSFSPSAIGTMLSRAPWSTSTGARTSAIRRSE